MLSEDVALRDWNIHVSGKTNVIKATKDIFDSVSTISVRPISFFSNSDYAYAVLISITINGGQGMEVIDFINFNVDGKIESINAFRIENI